MSTFTTSKAMILALVILVAACVGGGRAYSASNPEQIHLRLVSQRQLRAICVRLLPPSVPLSPHVGVMAAVRAVESQMVHGILIPVDEAVLARVRILTLATPHRDRILDTDGHLHGDLAWSPNGRALAFLGGASLWVWRASCGCSRPAVRGSSRDPVRSFAWSSDSRRLAVFRQPQNQFPTARVPLSVLDARTTMISTVWVDFPAGIGNSRIGAGSYPSQLLGWTATNRVLIGTSGWGIGAALTGIWSAPATGGQAQLALGARSHGYVVSNRVLLNADAALLSPDRNRLLIGSDSRFWLGTVTGMFSRWLNPAISRSCQVTQFS